MGFPLLPTPCEDLRGGKLSRDDQLRRDELMAEAHLDGGATLGEIADAFQLGYVTVWYAMRRQGIRLTMSEHAIRREIRKRRKGCESEMGAPTAGASAEADAPCPNSDAPVAAGAGETAGSKSDPGTTHTGTGD